MPSQAQRLEYVLKNFFLVYQCPPEISAASIAYGVAQPHTQLFLPDFSGGYFTNPLPAPSDFNISWIEVGGRRLPLLFSSDNEFVSPSGVKHCLRMDVVSTLFYFLSGWQEHTSKERDRLGRFVYETSLQKSLHIWHLPVVHYYFLLLKDAIEQTWQVKLEKRWPIGGRYVFCATHDVDVWQTLWRKELKAALKKGQLGKALNITLRKMANQHWHDSFEPIQALQKEFGFRPTYFFLPSMATYGSEQNADYDINNPFCRGVVQQLAQLNEVGLHGSFGASYNAAQLTADKGNMPIETNGYRSHYLMFDAEKTPSLLSGQNMVYDSTLGFNSHPGFRHGTAYPFYLFDFSTNTASSVLEIPLVCMDASLFYNHYLAFSTAVEAFDYLSPLLSEMVATGGCFTVNWHNDAFMQPGRGEWQTLFRMLLQHAQKHNSTFMNCAEIVAVAKE